MNTQHLYRGLFGVLLLFALGSCAADHVWVAATVEDVYVVPETAEALLTISIRDRLVPAIDQYALELAEAERQKTQSAALRAFHLHFPAPLKSVYEKAPPSGWWMAWDGTLDSAGEELYSALKNSHLHGLSVSDYGVERIRSLRDEVERAQEQALRPLDFVWSNEEVNRLERFLQQHGTDTQDLDGLLGEILGLGVMGRRAFIAMEERAGAYRRLFRASAKLDIALSDGLIGYAWDLRVVPGRLLTKGPLNEEELTRATPPNADVDPAQIVIEQTRAQVALFLGVAARQTDLAEALGALEPRYEQYGRLLDAYKDYLGYCSGDGWVQVPGKRTLRLRRSGEDVDVLRRRLAQEGYAIGEVEPGAPYDEALRDAVNLFQEDHQFEVTGVVNKRLRKALNVPCTTRLAQIGVTLQKWRESHIQDPLGTFLFVNIPDFHGEYWEGGQRIHRFRVVVGKRELQSRNAKRFYRWATPELTSEVRHLVFNPYWNVPESILSAEKLKEKMVEEPNYAVEHHYELIEDGGETLVRQDPGPWNALGKVKFVFPNPYSVYLHDTPSQSKFRYPIRSFSHGCMRVEKATELAQILLTRQGKWRKKYLREDGKSDWWVGLPQPIPIHVEYYLVRVADDGRVLFGSDIYRRDAHRVAAFHSKLEERPVEREANTSFEMSSGHPKR